MVLHPELGLTLTDAETAALPSVRVMAGVAHPMIQTFQMQPYQNTDSGIVLGAAPQGNDRAMAWANRVYGYTMKQADGTFSPFVPLAVQFEEHSVGDHFLSIDAQGNLLDTSRFGPKPTLTDLNTGTTTDLESLLPPGTLDRSGFTGTIIRGKISADGTIFAVVQSGDYNDGSTAHMLMLTPPVPTPEPSTLVTFGVIVVGLSVARRRSKV